MGADTLSRSPILTSGSLSMMFQSSAESPRLSDHKCTQSKNRIRTGHSFQEKAPVWRGLEV
jgi:hypothetical protein